MKNLMFGHPKKSTSLCLPYPPNLYLCMEEEEEEEEISPPRALVMVAIMALLTTSLHLELQEEEKTTITNQRTQNIFVDL